MDEIMFERLNCMIRIVLGNQEAIMRALAFASSTTSADGQMLNRRATQTRNFITEHMS